MALSGTPMDNHYPWLIETPEPNLVDGMRRVQNPQTLGPHQSQANVISAFPEESAGQDKIMRPIRPKRERSHGSFFSKSVTSRAERSVIEFVRIAQKDRFLLQEIDKLSQVAVSKG
jgi:hypothetical protein